MKRPILFPLILTANVLLPQSVKAQGPVGWWTFNDDTGTVIFDSSGNGNTGTANNVFRTADRFGVLNAADSFNGVNSRITVNDAPSLRPSTITISAWVKPASLGADRKIAGKNSSSGDSYNLGIYSNNKIEFWVQSSAWYGVRSVSGGTAVDTGVWYHVVGVYDGNTITTYLNGQADRSAVVGSVAIQYNTNPFYIGQTPGTSYFKGVIDDIRIYDRALSGAEIQSLFGRFFPSIIAFTPNPTYNRRPQLRWYRHDSISTFRIQIDTSQQFTAPIVSATATDTFYIPVNDLPYDTIYWRVRNDADSLSWSTISSVRIVRAVPALIAYTPNPTYNRQPQLRWYRNDSISTFRIQIDTTQLFASPIVSQTVVDTFFSPTTDLPYDTIYWRVRNEADTLSWSTVSSVRIIGYAPTLIAYTPNPTYNRRPLLLWRKHDSIPLFRIQIDTVNQFFSPMVSTTTTDTFYTPAADLPYDTIYWRVGNEADPRAWSTVSSVRVIRSVPTLIAYSPDPTDNRQPLLRWHPVSGTSLYSIQISTAPDFSSFIVTGNVSDTFYTPSLKLPRDTIYWRVRTDLDTLFSAPDMFTINPPPLLVPIVNGNRWVYSYNDTVRISYGYPPGFSLGAPFWDTVKAGTFNLSLSSVFTRSDSVFFTATAVDSGLITFKTGHISQDTTITTISGYNTSLIAECMVADSLLYRKDSLGTWTSYNPWYLSYEVPADTYSNTTPPSTPYTLTYQRNTAVYDTSINSAVHVLYSTTARRYWYQYIVREEVSNTTNDTMIWIKDFGVPYKAIKYSAYDMNTSSYTVSGYQKTNRWSLVSFTVATTSVSQFPSLRRGIPAAFSITGTSGIVRYALPEQCRVSLKYFDLRGRLVANLVNAVQGAGYYTLSVKNVLPSFGTYIRVFEAGSFIKRDLVPIVKK